MKKVKSKVRPGTDRGGPEWEEGCSSTLSLTSALDGVGGQRYVPASLPPAKGPSTPHVGGWVGPRAYLDEYGKSCPLEYLLFSELFLLFSLCTFPYLFFCLDCLGLLFCFYCATHNKNINARGGSFFSILYL